MLFLANQKNPSCHAGGNRNSMSKQGFVHISYAILVPVFVKSMLGLWVGRGLKLLAKFRKPNRAPSPLAKAHRT